MVLQHHDHISLGNFEAVLRDRGYEIVVVDAPTADLDALDPREGDIVIVLGGHEAAYELERFPYLTAERDFVRRRLDAQLPILGVCLGAQLMAGALGGRNYRGEKPDLGYQDIRLTAAGEESPVQHVAGVRMLEWHGDHFELPEREEVTLLATSDAYPNEAFAVGDFGLAVQFHPEVTEAMHEVWSEDTEGLLRREGIDREEWRELGRTFGPPMQRASAAMLNDWLDRVEARASR